MKREVNDISKDNKYNNNNSNNIGNTNNKTRIATNPHNRTINCSKQ